MSDEVTFDYVKSLENDKNVLLIDVREPSELEKTGRIPGSINIPLATLEDTLQNWSEEDFREKFQREKPNSETAMVFSCHMGRRSQAALDAAKKMGFIHAKHFPGGWAGWEQETKNAS
ncbi:thiosulfate sulfurtransferase/rhodanese-like domain-containing protein 3 isoform X2 [Zophobas morio]